MISRLFRSHGELCASHPWEVIVATVTLTACLVTVEPRASLSTPPHKETCQWRHNCVQMEDYNAADMIIMTIIRCVAILYSYYQFCNLQKLGSKYILGIAGLFTVCSSFVFSSSVINMMHGDTSGLKDALFFFLLLIDLSKTTLLAQFALSASSPDEVRSNIARGMAKLGPTITLDTLVETLVIGVGTLSGFRRLEVLCTYACMSVLVNYLVFMTFYPACLSLVLELSRIGASGQVTWQSKLRVIAALTDETQKPNPVVQRVKLIMSAGLVLVHARSRWPFSGVVDNLNTDMDEGVVETLMPHNATAEQILSMNIMRWVSVNADHIVVLILLLALAFKFILFEDDDRYSSDLVKEELQNGLAASALLQPPCKPLRAANGIRVDVILEDKESQTDNAKEEKAKETSFERQCSSSGDVFEELPETVSSRDLDQCVAIYKTGGVSTLSDNEVALLVKSNIIPGYKVEEAVRDPTRGVGIRRKVISNAAGFKTTLDELPYQNYDYRKVMGQCCENVIGYVPVPVGVAGPLKLDGKSLYVPMATTEGCLVASTNRGARAVSMCGGVTTRVVGDGMTRGPVIRFTSMTRASEAMEWMQNPDNFEELKESFDASSRFARLTRLNIRIAGRHLFIRFVATTGDAMGMNMLSKGTELALETVRKHFPDMELLSLSGNFCADKKPAAVNWIEGRGKSVVAEAVVSCDVVEKVLKTTVRGLVDVNISKNLIGSAVAGSIGGFNAHAANIVTAIYIATGQDPAQNVASSSCITLMEPCGESGRDLYISCSMPSIEIGTVGGGTTLPPQASCLDMLGVRGSNEANPGENAKNLARIICATVLAGELSLMSALTAGHLVRSHLTHNRSSASVSSLSQSQS